MFCFKKQKNLDGIQKWEGWDNMKHGTPHYCIGQIKFTNHYPEEPPLIYMFNSIAAFLPEVPINLKLIGITHWDTSIKIFHILQKLHSTMVYNYLLYDDNLRENWTKRSEKMFVHLQKPDINEFMRYYIVTELKEKYMRENKQIIISSYLRALAK